MVGRECGLEKGNSTPERGETEDISHQTVTAMALFVLDLDGHAKCSIGWYHCDSLI